MPSDGTVEISVGVDISHRLSGRICPSIGAVHPGPIGTRGLRGGDLVIRGGDDSERKQKGPGVEPLHSWARVALLWFFVSGWALSCRRLCSRSASGSNQRSNPKIVTD